jgi:antitoxin ParD1/3/4
MITKLSISLPQSLEQFAREQVRTGGYGSISEYLRELIRLDQRLSKMKTRRDQIPRENRMPYEIDRFRHGG